MSPIVVIGLLGLLALVSSKKGGGGNARSSSPKSDDSTLEPLQEDIDNGLEIGPDGPVPTPPEPKPNTPDFSPAPDAQALIEDADADRAIAEKAARLAREREAKKESSGKVAPKGKSAPPSGATKPSKKAKKPAKVATKPAPPAPTPKPPEPVANDDDGTEAPPSPPPGFDRALAKKTAKQVANHIANKKSNYSRDVLKGWQVRAGIPADGIYGRGSHAALRYYTPNAPAALFAQGEDSYPWKE